MNNYEASIMDYWSRLLDEDWVAWEVSRGCYRSTLSYHGGWH